MTADLPDGYTATQGTPSGDAEGVEVPGWWMKPDGSKPHRWAEESCPKVACVKLTLPVGLVRELALGNGHSDIEEDA